MYSELTEALQTMIESSLSDVNTSMPGKIVSYDPKTNRATVMPTMPKAAAGGDPIAAPHIVEVPVVWPSGGGATFTMPIKEGDGVMLSYQQRSLEGWLSGSEVQPDDPRQFDLSDCVAIPGLQHSGITGNHEDVVLSYGKGQLTIKQDGSVTLGNDKGSITIDSGGTMTLHAQSIKIETSGGNFVLETHQHIEVQSGTGVSGKPLT